MSGDAGETARDATPPSSGLALPAFTSMRNSSPSSDHAGSNTSGSWRKSWASHGSDLRNGRSPTPEEAAPKEAAFSPRNVTSGSIPGPSRSRQSGGFLLDSKSRPTRLSSSLLSRNHKNSQDIKGKRKSEDGDLVVPKRRPTRRHQKQDNSIGGSPLATEVRRDVSGAEQQIQGGSDMGGSDLRSSPVPPRALGDVESVRDPNLLPPKLNPRSVGFDSDPAQIVNLALSLSEGRRRQASGMRVVSANISEARRVSTGYPAILQGARPSRAYFNENRQTSRNVSPVHENFNSPGPGGAGAQTVDETITARDQSYPEDADTEMLDVTPATFARVQKAKDHLELLYNFRRLLSHLPPIHRPGASLSAEASRIYNPLQYSRNRKLRFREKKPIPSEEEGWHDIQQVRTWVDAVIANHRETRHRPDECIRLPDLTQQKLQNTEDEEGVDKPDSATSSRRASHNPAAKPRRPKSDWVTHPGELLADAFWLEQGLNKLKIEDKDGNKIYPPHTNFSFSGWRNRTPLHAYPQQPTPPPEEDQFSEELPEEPQSAVPDLPNFTSAHTHSRKHTSRGRRRDKLRDSVIGLHKGENGSGSRRKRLRKELEMSSSSEESEDGAGSRGRTRTSGRKVKPKTAKDQPALDEHSMDMVDSDAEHGTQSKGSSSANTSKRPSIVDGARLAKFISRNSSKAGSERQDSAHRTESQRQSLDQPRMGRSSLEGERHPRSSVEYDTTAPSSPTAAQFPSIAINLSPPHSRPPSPSKKPLQSLISPFRDRSREKRQNGIEASDFAIPDNPDEGTFHFNGSIAGTDVSPRGSRDASPHTRGTSPMTKRDSHTSVEPVPRHEPHRSSTVSKISTRSSGSHHDHSSRIKGIFKGGRIAELVGHEVSRVSDYIWKRDPPSHVQRSSQSTTSLTSVHSNESEDSLKHANGNASKTPPQKQSGRVVSAEITPEGKLSRTQSRSTPSSGEQEPQYHISNLPSFTSPFQRDREREEERGRLLLTPTSSPPQDGDGDHISQLAAAHRSASKSPRLDRLKPPQLVTTRPSSPSPSNKLDYVNSYGFGNALDLSRVTSASQSMNSALRPKDYPVTGLAGLKTSVSGNDLVRGWNTPDREGDTKVTVTKRDIARARTLLTSSGVKAREISRRANAIELPRKFLLDTIEPSDPIFRGGKPFKVSRKEEHVVAAKNLMSSLTAQSHQFRSALDRFTGKTTPALHQSLQGLDDLVDNTLTPRVRVAADQAGDLSMKLSSNSALAVKELNDIINGAFRRRRRGPVRYLRRFGYLLLEWSVVGLLWAMWAIWLVFAVTFGSITGVYKTVWWLLNFDGLQVLLLAFLLLLSNTLFSEASVALIE